MLPIHWRMAELTVINRKRELTQEEMEELRMCLDANATYAFKLSALYNLSSVASMIDDDEWLNEICMDIDRLEIQYRIQK
jgi:hypothetical protein